MNHLKDTLLKCNKPDRKRGQILCPSTDRRYLESSQSHTQKEDWWLPGWGRAGLGSSRLTGRVQDCEIKQCWRREAVRWSNTVNGLMPLNCSFKLG